MSCPRWLTLTVALVYSFTLVPAAFAETNCPGGVCLGTGPQPTSELEMLNTLTQTQSTESLISELFAIQLGEQKNFQTCDINQDGLCDAQDKRAEEAIDKYLRSQNPNCDTNRDGKCNSSDLNSDGTFPGTGQQPGSGQGGSGQQGGQQGQQGQFAQILMQMLPMLIQKLLQAKGQEGANKTPQGRPMEGGGGGGGGGCAPTG